MKRKFENTDLPSWLVAKDPWKLYTSNNYVVFDFETTNLDHGTALNHGNKLLLSTWVCGEGHRLYGDARVHHHWGDEFHQDGLLEALRTADFIVAQNAKFELQWLHRMGCDLHDLVVWDTMLAEYVRLGNRRGPKDLDSICKHYGVELKLPLVKELIEGGVCPSEIPARWLEEYGIGDTRNTHAVFLLQREELRKLNLLPVLWTRCLTTPVLAEIELNGMHADKEAVYAEYESTLARYKEAQSKVTEITGGINLNSPKQVGEFLYDSCGFAELVTRQGEPDRTDAGGRRTDEDAIAALKANTDLQQAVQGAFLAAKPLYKRLDTLTKLKNCVDQDEGILYANLNQAVTQTHRLSSSGRKHRVQYQNIDRDLKPMFSARHPGWLIGEADGSSLEFRGAGYLGRDEVIKADIRSGFDPHKFSASVLHNCSIDEVTKEWRQDAKPDTFKPLYGGKSGTPAQVRYYKAFQQRYAGLYRTQTDWTYEVLKTKQLVTEWGFIFYWPDTTQSRSGYISNTTSIFNYPIQSFCTAEIIPISLVFFWHRAKRLGLRLMLVNTVHDSIICELPEEEEGIFRDLADHCFTTDVFDYLWRNYEIKISIPLGTETKVGTHWGKGGERKYSLDPDVFLWDSAKGGH